MLFGRVFPRNRPESSARSWEHCKNITLPDRGGKELGGEEVGDGEGGGDEKLAGHGQGEDHPHLCQHGGTLESKVKVVRA